MLWQIENNYFQGHFQPEIENEVLLGCIHYMLSFNLFLVLLQFPELLWFNVFVTHSLGTFPTRDWNLSLSTIIILNKTLFNITIGFWTLLKIIKQWCFISMAPNERKTKASNGKTKSSNFTKLTALFLSINAWANHDLPRMPTILLNYTSIQMNAPSLDYSPWSS